MAPAKKRDVAKGSGKRRGPYKQWQTKANVRVPRSTLSARRLVLVSPDAKTRKTTGSVPKRACAATAASGCISASPLLVSHPVPCFKKKSDPIQQLLHETEVDYDVQDLIEARVDRSALRVFTPSPTPDPLPTSTLMDVTNIPEAYGVNTGWIVVPDEVSQDDCAVEEIFDEEEPFTLRLDLSDDELTEITDREPSGSPGCANVPENDNVQDSDDVQESDNVQESDDDASDDDLAKGSDLRLSVDEKIKLLLLLATKRKHKLSYSAAEDVMELAGVVCEDSKLFLPSRHTMKEAISKFSFALQEHHVCPNCGKYIGVVTTPTFHCATCADHYNVATNRKSGSMFLYLSLHDQIKALLESVISPSDVIVPENRQKINKFNYEDIFDGKQYKIMSSQDTLTFTFFVDGVQIATTRKTSAWPILLVINELPIRLRRQHILMASLWLSKKKPIMNEYMRPFVKESLELSRSGVTIRTKSGALRTFFVKACVCVSDSIARPLLRNSAQFNGRFGCGLCNHPGIRMRKGRGHTTSYSIKDGSYPLRTHEELMNMAERADRTGKTQRGIKGTSILSRLPDFDMVRCIDLDSFHSIVNVAKRFCNLWFMKPPKGCAKPPYNISDKIKEVDKRLLSITPTSEVSRAPTSLTERSDYRGHEWYYFVVFYSVPVLKNILPCRYLNHWCLLVHGLVLIMQNSVAKSELVYSGRYLMQFVTEIDDLYGPENVTFSIHLLTHLERSVSDFSQPWTHSAFVFESFNNEIKETVKSSNGAALQICKGMQLKIALKNLEDDVGNSMSQHEKIFLEKMFSRGKRLAAPHLSLKSISMLGIPKIQLISQEARRAIFRAGGVCHEREEVPVYERCRINRDVYHGAIYSKVSKQNNCVVLLTSGEVFFIEYFVVLSSSCYILGQYFEEKRGVKLSDVILPHYRYLKDQPEGTLRCIKPTQISSKLLSWSVSLSPTNKFRLGCVNVLLMEMLS